ncbi:MFS transporter [Alicyclobacillus hesperidum subsp. aegles]|uniref:MFS transporter n=1 Tax=Alicyclobacillus hesperidum TaxID=89784 RepID=UPI00222B72E0|nr:MFS transporter [Alicyclobacillus hesperidum]GLG02490.1 MFS transporter [Alicyclobacillus hesperidum subsp. aegles]
MSANPQRPHLGWNFGLLVMGQGISQIGNNLFSLALLWFVLIKTHNRADLAYVACALTVPNILGLLSGTLIDRMNRWNVMIGSDSIRLILSVVMGLVAVESQNSIIILIVLGVLIQVAGSAFQPAQVAIIPSLVSHELLGRANGINQMVTMGTQIVGMASGGALMAVVGLPTLFFINAATFLFSVITLFLVRQPSHMAELRDRSFWSDWTEGMKIVVYDRLLRRLITIAIIVNFSLAPVMSLDAAWVRQILRQNTFHYGLAGACLMVGVIIGNGLYGALAEKIRPSLVLPIALSVMSFSVICFANIPRFSVFAICLSVFGAFAGAVNTMVFTMVQNHVPAHSIGRVAGTLLALTTASLPLGMSIAGFLARHLSLNWIFSGGGALAFIGVAISIGLRSLASRAKSALE